MVEILLCGESLVDETAYAFGVSDNAASIFVVEEANCDTFRHIKNSGTPKGRSLGTSHFNVIK